MSESVSAASMLKRGPTCLHGGKLYVIPGRVIPSQSVGGCW